MGKHGGLSLIRAVHLLDDVIHITKQSNTVSWGGH